MLFLKSKNIIYNTEVMNWKNIPEPIEQMEYKITHKQSIIFEGFDAYLRLKEMYKGVNCNIKGMSKKILFGRTKNEIAIIEINCKTGEIKQYTKKRGQEYNNRPLNENLWKQGIKGIPRIYLKEIED